MAQSDSFFSPGSWGSGRILRVAITILLIVIVLWWTVPSLYSYTSVKAVVNTWTIDIRSPRTGQITMAPPEVGASVSQNEILTQVVDKKVDPTNLKKIQGNLATTKEEINNLSHRQQKLTELLRTLKTRFETFKQKRIRVLQNRINKVESRVREKSSRLSEVKARIERIRLKDKRNMYESESIAQTELRESIAIKDQIKHQIQAINHKLDELKTQFKSAQQGVFVDVGSNDVPYSQQRIDQLRIEREQIRAQKQKLKTQKSELKKQIRAQKKYDKQLRKDTVRSPVDGPVWRSTVENRSHVSEGQLIMKLIDCSNMFLQVVVPERFFNDLSKGEQVKVRMLGSSKTIKGSIQSVYGGAAAKDQLNVARKPNVGQGELLVIVTVPNKNYMHSEDSFCGVGRTAEVTFPFYPGVRDIIENVFS